MFHKVSQIIKACAYIYLFGNIVKDGYSIAINTSYLNTGELMGVESMFLMLWSFFVSFLISLMIYGFGEVVEYCEKEKSIIADDLTKSDIDVK